MLKQLKENMMKQSKDALIICDPDSVYYFTGCKIAPGERMYLLLVTKDRSLMILPEMFKEEAKTADAVEKIFFKDTDNFIQMATDELKMCRAVGVDKFLVAKFLLPIMKQLPDAEFEDGSFIVDFMRMHKNPEECEKMRLSSALNDKIITEFATYLASPEALGISEKEGVKVLLDIAEKNGAEDISFEPIVSFGDGTAQPHHEPAADVFLRANCPVILDIGFVKHGYCSDMTRSFFRTESEMLRGGDPNLKTVPAEARDRAEKFSELYDIVRRANLAGIAKIAPGVPLAEVDAAARDLIAKEGYGDFFTHRLGHGIGIAVHEFPDVSAASDAVCAKGMIFSIEPGIYHPESGIGIRIEDLVLVTEDGCEVLNKVPK